jgi:16S rRNA G966 N2-methylase RsmD
MKPLADGAQWVVLHGDCAEVLPSLEDKSVAHVLTDPPYSARVHANATGHARSKTLRDGNGKLYSAALSRRMELGFEHLSAALRRTVAREAARLASRWTLVFSDEDSMHLWRRSLESCGLQAVRSMFWIRRGGAPQFTGDRPAVAVEAITLAHPPGRKRWNGGGKAGLYDFPIVANRSGHRSDRIHTTQKPLPLMESLVSDFTDPGDIIIDPFCGSGTTGVAAVRLGRRFIGIERDADYVQVARDRISSEDNGSTLQAARAGQVPLFTKAAP